MSVAKHTNLSDQLCQNLIGMINLISSQEFKENKEFRKNLYPKVTLLTWMIFNGEEENEREMEEILNKVNSSIQSLI
jgi:hypothetical protein